MRLILGVHPGELISTLLIQSKLNRLLMSFVELRQRGQRSGLAYLAPRTKHRPRRPRWPARSPALHPLRLAQRHSAGIPLPVFAFTRGGSWDLSLRPWLRGPDRTVRFQEFCLPVTTWTTITGFAPERVFGRARRSGRLRQQLRITSSTSGPRAAALARTQRAQLPRVLLAIEM